MHPIKFRLRYNNNDAFYRNRSRERRRHWCDSVHGQSTRTHARVCARARRDAHRCRFGHLPTSWSSSSSSSWPWSSSTSLCCAYAAAAAAAAARIPHRRIAFHRAGFPFYTRAGLALSSSPVGRRRRRAAI